MPNMKLSIICLILSVICMGMFSYYVVKRMPRPSIKRKPNLKIWIILLILGVACYSMGLYLCPTYVYLCVTLPVIAGPVGINIGMLIKLRNQPD